MTQKRLHMKQQSLRYQIEKIFTGSLEAYQKKMIRLFCLELEKILFKTPSNLSTTFCEYAML